MLTARAFPRAKIAVVVATRRLAWKVWRRMRRVLPERIGLMAGSVRSQGTRCVVGTFGFIDRPADGRHDLLLLPDAERSTGDRAARIIAALGSRRRYAFVTAGRRKDWLAALRLEQIAGHVIAEHKRPRAQLIVAFAPVPDHTVRNSRLPLVCKRRLYWKNAARNRCIAAVAGAASAGDSETLVALGIERINFKALWRFQASQLAVLVESVEHAQQIARLLPGWEVLAGYRHGQRSPRAGDYGRRNIVAAVYAAHHRVPADVVIRASGGEGSLHMKGMPRAVERGLEPGALLLLDFADVFDKRATASARRRALAYQQGGAVLNKNARELVTERQRMRSAPLGAPV